MSTPLIIRSAARSDVGRKRENNEDWFTIDPERGLYVVADGIGGHSGGEVAASLAVEAFVRAVDTVPDAPFLADPSLHNRQLIFDWLALVTDEANSAIYQGGRDNPQYRGMGCTLDAVLIRGAGAFFVHVGDSRAYLLRGVELTQLTEDHTLGQLLLSVGHITRDELKNDDKRNVLMRALGVLPKVQPDVFFVDLAPGDRLLLCSDGLTNEVPHDRLRLLLASEGAKAPDALVDAALEAGGRDNITAVVVSVDNQATPRRRTVIGDAETERSLKASVLFGTLSGPELLRVQRIAVEKTVPAGATVFEAGDVGDALYMVMSGRLTVEGEGADIGRFRPGDHFGEMALIDDIPRSATVRATTEARLLAFPRIEFEGLVVSDFGIGNKVLRRLLIGLSLRLRELNGEVAGYRHALASAALAGNAGVDPK